MTRPTLTLTTDFGLGDHFVGTMKGVILGICPEAQIVDISHDVTPFEIAEGAYLIAQAWRYFLKKTVHVVVVDPGVGTARRPILVEAGGQYFIGPDNGVLSMVYLQEKSNVRLISNEKYFRHPVSKTFHGRDIFAPVAAHLAGGIPAARCAATGAKMSRPWNVLLTGWRKYFSLEIRRTLLFSCRYTMESTPLSGPIKYCPPASTRIGRRAVPTPGSTTTTCTVFFGK